MIILGKRYDLSNVDTFKFLIENGADIHINDDCALNYSADYGHFHIVKFLVDKGADISAGNDFALIWSSFHGHFDVVKFLVKHGADIHAQDNYALKWSTQNGERIGTNIPFSTFPLGQGHTNVANFLISKDAKPKNLI